VEASPVDLEGRDHGRDLFLLAEETVDCVLDDLGCEKRDRGSLHFRPIRVE
jgi:hypothetical protein